jgi:hypothetical protein
VARTNSLPSGDPLNPKTVIATTELQVPRVHWICVSS